ncbi:MAG TPA: hypothetical protein ENH84_03485 [Phycisphaerae bacterium]|nr:hypothetical protein [Phycisphaerae bacterium]
MSPPAVSKTRGLAALGWGILAVAGCMLSGGCKQPCPPLETVVGVDVVVAEYNREVRRIGRLWARADIAFKENAIALPLHTDGLLVLQKAGDPAGPQDFFLKFKEAGQEIGRIGISMQDDVYYTWFIAGGKQQCLWGWLGLAGAPGIEAIPIDPTQLLSVLSVCELPAPQRDVPFVGQTIRTDPCAYVLTYADRQPITGKLLFKREVYFRWSLSEPRRPFMVKLLDERGICVLTARMKDYRPVQLADGNDRSDEPPMMPTDIRLTWTKTGSELHLKLSGMTTDDRVDPDAYRFWDRLPVTLRTGAVQVDADLNPPVGPVGRPPKRDKD